MWTILLAAATLVINARTAPTNASIDATDGSLNGTDTALPQVNLGYVTHRATNFNSTGQYFNFSNIRYAAPPLGRLRFADPAPPNRQSGIQSGDVGNICPQSVPGYWQEGIKDLGDLVKYLPDAVNGQAQSEDCLFLDVMAPSNVFNEAKRGGSLVPVLVNIHGGGFFVGDKRTINDPQGFLSQSDNGLIYVSMNYRLGAFGFLSGLPKSSANSLSPNAGLLDQRYALKWVQKYISLFGGDPNRVTILGQSAGGGAVEIHTIAYGGSKENNLFRAAIAQSPASAVGDPKSQTIAANLFLQAAGARTVDELRQKSTQVLQAAQQKAQDPAPFTVGYFAPSVDGDLIPDLPRKLYKQGRYIKNLQIMSGHTLNEARLFGNQSISNDAGFVYWAQQNFPSASPAVISYITNNLYPPRYDGSYPWRTPLERATLASTEFVISCNTVDMARAYGGRTFNYLFNVPPAIHSQDLLYTYYNGQSGKANPNLALPFQKGFVQFALTGNPNRPGQTTWPVYNGRKQVLNLGSSGLSQTTEPADNPRCNWWLQGRFASGAALADDGSGDDSDVPSNMTLPAAS